MKYKHKPSEMIQVECRNNERRAVMDPLPIGPYILVHQNDETKFLKSYFVMQHVFYKDFKTQWGYSTYAIGLDGTPMLVAYWHDCS